MLRIYDEFLEDESVQSLKDRSYRLHVSALIYCSRNLTDGVVTVRASKVLQAILGFHVKRHITDLVEAGIWVPMTDGGWLIRNYLEFNPAASTVKKERAAARKRMKQLRDKRAGSGEGADEGSGEHPGEGAGAVPNQSLPVPSFEIPKAVKSERPSDESIPELKLREVS